MNYINIVDITLKTKLLVLYLLKLVQTNSVLNIFRDLTQELYCKVKEWALFLYYECKYLKGYKFVMDEKIAHELFCVIYFT